MTCHIRHWGIQDYTSIWQAMREFTEQRTAESRDEIWLGQHFPVFTQGQAGKAEHIIHACGIPIVQSDRGGQITYHGPGQLIAYTLVDLRRRHWTVRQMVNNLEQAVIRLLAKYHIDANTRCKAPGVYVQQAKIASVGLRIRRGCSYHGLALNVNMDLSPFQSIHPCGFADLTMTQLHHFIEPIAFAEVETDLTAALQHQLALTHLD